MQTTSTDTIEGSEDTFGKFKEAYTGQIYHIENFKSLVGAIAPTNYTDNMPELIKQVGRIPKKKEQSNDHYQTSMVRFNEEYTKYTR